jgi:hexosaminidase
MTTSLKKQISSSLIILSIIISLCSLSVHAEEPVIVADMGENLGLVPLPVELQRLEGTFLVDQSTVVAAPQELFSEAELLAEPLRRATSFPIPVVLPSKGKPTPGTILFRQSSGKAAEVTGSYLLTVSPKLVTIDAGTPAGHFYATRTLLQLLPPQAATAKQPSVGEKIQWTLPCLKIRDRPRFQWRSLMIDEARNFNGLDCMKTMINEMAALKMNVLHWHLTDSEAWRLEIRRYPKLTSVGGRFPGKKTGFIPPQNPKDQPKRYYYTQAEARELIEYAARRHVQIVPEIEMPGHSTAMIRSYPEWGAGDTKILDTSNPEAVRAMTEILDEVMALFPSTVIHTGGDEVNFKSWATAPSIQAAMKKKGLKSPESLQQAFTTTMAKYISSKGRRMIYWADSKDQIPDEKTAILQFWHGDPSLITHAISQGYDLINSWNRHTYFDYSYGRLPLERAYEFDPIPAGLKPQWHKHILGAGCQAWAEFIPTSLRLEYMVFPRLAAFAEVGWTPVERKKYSDFVDRLKFQERRWDLAGIRYAPGRDISSKVLIDGVKSRGKKVGTWTPDQLRICSSPYAITAENNHDLDITDFVDEAGRIQVVFVPTGGEVGLHVRQVELLEDGIAIAGDVGGFGGTNLPKIQHVFDLPLSRVKPGSTYTLRANYYVLKGKKKISSGDIYIRNVGGRQ